MASSKQFEPVSLLSTGSYGTIHLCRRATVPDADAAEVENCCVVKTVKLAKAGPKERFAAVQEVSLLKQLQHRNLVCGIDAWLDGHHTAHLAMAHCAAGDLTGLLAEHREDPLPEEYVCRLFVQVGYSVCCCTSDGCAVPSMLHCLGAQGVAASACDSLASCSNSASQSRACTRSNRRDDKHLALLCPVLVPMKFGLVPLKFGLVPLKFGPAHLRRQLACGGLVLQSAHYNLVKLVSKPICFEVSC